MFVYHPVQRFVLFDKIVFIYVEQLCKALKLLFNSFFFERKIESRSCSLRGRYTGMF